MKYNVITYGNPILRKKSGEVEEINEEVKKLISDMIEIMSKKGGIGLAAPQMGVSKQIAIIGYPKKPFALINPKILRQEGEKKTVEEGCLSVPGIRANVEREDFVEVEFLDQKGNKKILQAEDMLARVIQHEIDHLKGKLFIDRLGLGQKLKILPKLQRLKLKGNQESGIRNHEFRD